MRELVGAFTPTCDEIAWARAQTRSDQHLMTLLVLLKCHQRLGYFPRLAAVPAAVVERVREVTGLSQSVVAEHRAARTGKRLRAKVRARLGVTWQSAEVRAVAEAAMREASLSKDNPADVINMALEALTSTRCELPGYSTLDEMAAAVRTEVNGGLHRLVAGRLDAADRARLLELLVVDPVTRRSMLPRLTEPAPRATVTRLKQHLGLLCWMDSLGTTEVWLAGVPPAEVTHFAGEAAVIDAAELGDVGVEKRLTLLVCLVHTARTRARDEVVTMFCKRMAAITKKARDHLQELREAHREQSERLLSVFGEVLSGVREALAPSAAENAEGVDDIAAVADPIGVVCERAGRVVLQTLAQAGGVAALSSTHEAVSAHHGNNWAPLMERYYRSHRSVLFELLDTLDLEATSTDRTVLDAVEFLKANRHRVGEYIPDHFDGAPVDLSFAARMWEPVLRDRRRRNRLRRRHFEVCVFAHLARELRSGDIAVRGSDSYANLYTQLMSWPECEPLVGDYCTQAGLAPTAGECVTAWRDELTRVAATVDAGYPANTDLILDGGRPILKRRAGKDRRASALALESAILDRMPERGLLEILTRTAYRIGWTRHFGPASGSDPKLRDALGRYVLTAFCYGTLLGPAQVARHMREQVSAHELARAFHQHCGPALVQAADTDVINAFARLDVAGLWGDGKVVAADGSQVDSWENSLLAETSIRYGGVGLLAYRHVSDTYIALFSRFIPCGVWEAVYILDGLLANTSEVQPDAIHADTQGPVAAGARVSNAARVRAAAPDPQLARPELLPSRPDHPLPAHRRLVRREQRRLGADRGALARSDPHRDQYPGRLPVLGDPAAPARQRLPQEPALPRVPRARAGHAHHRVAAVPVRTRLAGVDHRDHQPGRSVPRIRRLARLWRRRRRHRPQRPRLPGETHQVQSTPRQLRHLPDRVRHHRHRQHARRRRPSGRPRRPGNDQPLHHSHRPPLR